MNSIIERMALEANLLEEDLEGLAGPYGGNKHEINKFVDMLFKQLMRDLELAKLNADNEDWDRGYDRGLETAISFARTMVGGE